MAKGSTLLVGFKNNSSADWGVGAGCGAALVGAGDGVEVNSESVKIDAGIIPHKGLSGYGTSKPGTHGNKMVSGDLVCPLYWRGLETLIAMAMGTAAAPAQQGATDAYAHTYTLAASHAGIHGTLVLPGSDHPAVREVAFAKVGGFTFDFKPGDEQMVTFPIVGFDMLFNEGALDADGVVAAVEPADGAQIVAGYHTAPFFLTVLMTDADNSVTEYKLTFVGTDENGDYQTETYTLSVDGKTWTGSKRWLTITSVTGSAKAGTSAGDTVQAGWIPGINTAATVASISLPTSGDVELCRFDQVRVWCNDQAGADFVDALPEDGGDRLIVDSLRIMLNLNLRTDKVSTRFGDRIDSPGENDMMQATIALHFPDWDTYNQGWIQRKLRAAKQKIKVTLTGPLAGTGYPCELSFFLNNVQFSGTDGPNAGGPQEIQLGLDGEAHRASASPTGLPAWANTQPISVYMINKRTTSALA